jgi:hypothetical protein
MASVALHTCAAEYCVTNLQVIDARFVIVHLQSLGWFVYLRVVHNNLTMSENNEEKFSIHSEVNRISFHIDAVHGFPDTTFYKGGYDARCSIEIFSNSFSANGVIYISTAQFHDFYIQLKKANESLDGCASIDSYENDFNTKVTFDGLGHATIQGYYSKYEENELKFQFDTDQTFIAETLRELSKIVDKYGDNYGNKNYAQHNA